LEAGGEVPPGLITAIARRILAMLPGDVLEVVSLAPTATIDIASWCRHSGHELLGMLADGDESSFWIRKSH
jgi:TusA-related sulfurtransferase